MAGNIHRPRARPTRRLTDSERQQIRQLAIEERANWHDYKRAQSPATAQDPLGPEPYTEDERATSSVLPTFRRKTDKEWY